MKCTSLTLLGVVGVLLPAAFGQYAVSTFAGGGPPNGAAATSIALSDVYGIAVDTAGNLYVPSSTQHRVYKATNGTIATVAGNGTLGYSGDNGPAANAQLNSPHSVAVDGAGNLYIADQGNFRIRKVTPGGVITTVAGTGTFGYSGDGGLATSAQISFVYGIAVDSAGNLYIADSGNYRIRKVSLDGKINTVAGTGTPGYFGDGGQATGARVSFVNGIAVDSAGTNLYLADSGNYRIRKVVVGAGITTVAGTGSFGYSGEGGSPTSAQISTVNGVAVDGAGNLYITDSGNYRIRKVVVGAAITTVAGTGTFGFSGDGASATSAQISTAWGVAVDSAGANVYIADSGNYRIRKVVGSMINTFAGNGSFEYSGDDGPATSAQISPAGIAANGEGSLYIADVRDYRIRKVSGSIIGTVAGNGTYGYSGDNGPATSAQIGNVSGVAVDGLGNRYIADSFNNRVRKVSGANITTVAGTGAAGYSGDNGPATNAQLGSLQGIAADFLGAVYITDQTNNRIRKISGENITLVAGGGPPDGSPATGVSIHGQKTAVDAAGNVYVASPSQNRVFKVATNGTVSTVAGTGTNGYSGDNGPPTSAQLSSPSGVAVDGANLYIADQYNNRIRKVSGGLITTVAGNGNFGYSGDGLQATLAQINYPSDVAVDSAGNLYIADQSNNRIRKVSVLDGKISTIAGTGANGYSGDSGQATVAQISFPYGIAVDSAGILYIADSGNYRIRKVSLDGKMNTVAGTGAAGYFGDFGQATLAQINFAYDVAVDGAGTTFYIADTGNSRIRKVTGGTISTVAGTGVNGYSGDGPAAGAQINQAFGVTVDSAGTNFYIADTGNYRIRKVSGVSITTVAGNGLSFSGDGGQAANAQLGSPSGLAVDNSGNLYISEASSDRVRVVSTGGTITTIAGGGTQGLGDGGPATSASLRSPRALAVDGGHNVYVVDSGNGRLRKVSSGGVISTITTIAGTDSFPSGNDAGVAVDSSGRIYLSDTVNGRVVLLAAAPVLTIGKTHAGNFAQGQSGATYTVTVRNTGVLPTNGTVTVIETAPAGLTLTSMAGTGWICAATTCTRNDPLPSDSTYSSITVTVNVSASAPAQVTNRVTVSGGGSADASANDLTTIGCAGVCPQTIVSVTPNIGNRGQLLATVAIVAQNTSFLQATTVASFGAGITVNNLTVTSPTTATANITVQSAAAFGSRTVTLTTGGQAASLTNGFTVISPTGCVVLASSSVNIASYYQPNSNVPPGSAVGSSVAITAAPGCSYTATTNVSWITLGGSTGSGNGTLYYVVAPNFSSTPRSAVVSLNGTPFTINQAADTRSPNERFISLLYNNFLSRAPDAGGFNSYVQSLNNGSLTRGQIAAGFFNSSEFNRVERFVAGLYMGILGRDAEFVGWDYHRRNLRNLSVTQPILVHAFINSPEYGLRYGSPDNATFVILLFNNALQRQPAPSEVAVFVAQLQNGVSRDNVAQTILNAPEFRTGALNRLNAFLMYFSNLSRDPDPAGVAGWIQLLNQGLTVQQALAGFIASPEFLALLGP